MQPSKKTVSSLLTGMHLQLPVQSGVKFNY